MKFASLFFNSTYNASNDCCSSFSACFRLPFSFLTLSNLSCNAFNDGISSAITKKSLNLILLAFFSFFAGVPFVTGGDRLLLVLICEAKSERN